jgi:methylated-DNA-[protein]-cysteine S-methyltransferase
MSDSFKKETTLLYPFYYTFTTTLIGKILLTASEGKLIGLYIEGQRGFPILQTHWEYQPAYPVLKETINQLDEYFTLERTDFNISY